MRETDPCLLQMFTRESLLASEWYRDRLRAKQSVDIALWTRHTAAVDAFLASGMPAPQIDWNCRVTQACEQLKRVQSDGYLAELVGTVGADPSVLANP